MTEKTPVEIRYNAIVASLEQLINLSQRQLDYLRTNKEKFLQCPVPCSMAGAFIDFDNPTRDQVLDIIRLFDGDWEKDSYGGQLDYKQVLPDGLRLRIYNAPLLANCRLVEDIPRQVPVINSTHGV